METETFGGSFLRPPVDRTLPTITKSAPCVHRARGAVLWGGLVYCKVTRQLKALKTDDMVTKQMIS